MSVSQNNHLGGPKKRGRKSKKVTEKELLNEYIFEIFLVIRVLQERNSYPDPRSLSTEYQPSFVSHY